MSKLHYTYIILAMSCDLGNEKQKSFIFTLDETLLTTEDSFLKKLNKLELLLQDAFRECLSTF